MKRHGMTLLGYEPKMKESIFGDWSMNECMRGERKKSIWDTGETARLLSLAKIPYAHSEKVI
jgi:hypothetical protein